MFKQAPEGNEYEPVLEHVQSKRLKDEYELMYLLEHVQLNP